eukprot:TRINITY_DN3146_c0_g1_i1.p2 TRINITY_DN3146_c0_g1~~TRINITY_DN3146_c0_g1_i1.p2  ORF type:complete len:405 (-),score=107.26 TRINITY_DN3146_c0_g1_i1:49-1239(-)
MLPLLLASAALAAPATTEDPVERAHRLHREHPLIDGHNDLPWQFRGRVRNAVSQLDLSVDQTAIGLHTDIPRLREGGVGAQFWSVYIPCSKKDKDAVRATMEQVDVTRRFIDYYPNDFALALTADDIERHFAAGKIAGLMGAEGGHSIDNSLGMLRMFYDAGVRYMTLTHNCDLLWVDYHAGGTHGGLTDFGRAVVREMNRLGMLVDISHVSVDTMNDVLDHTLAPVIFSHSSVFALCPVTRNVPDAIIERTAANGGVIMINFACSFVIPTGVPTVSDVADHIDYIKNLVGIETVGIGADYDGVDCLPSGLEDVSMYHNLTIELIYRGYTDADLVALLGGNLLRVLRATEAVAAQLQATTIPAEDWLEAVNTCRTPGLSAADTLVDHDPAAEHLLH